MFNSPICIYILVQEHNLNEIQNYCLNFIKKNPGVTYQIFTNVFDGSTKYVDFEPDIFFIDDIMFNKFIESVKTLKSKEMVVTFKRSIIFSERNKFLENRLLELSLFGVRNTFADIRNFPKILKSSVIQITNFQNARPKISLCLSGGGFDGYMYTLGVCVALENCLENFQMKDFDIFCGISSGAILSSCFAGGINTTELVQQAHKKHPVLESITIKTLFDFAISDFFKNTCQKTLPIGIFKGEKLKNFFVRQIKYFGVEDSFEALKKTLYIFATDQDTGEITVFGKDPWKKNIKISQAMRASIALPPFYLPENINGHWFTDGQLATSTEFDLPIHENVSLVLIIDPIVTYSTTQAGGVKKRGGYFTLLQAIKSLIHSRSGIALQHARDKHPDVDFIKFQPAHKTMEIMSGNPMRIPVRAALIMESAQATQNQILKQYDFFKHIFAKHGLTLRERSAIENI